MTAKAKKKQTSRASFAIATLQHYFKEQAKIIYPPRDQHNSREGELHPSSYPFCALHHGWNIVNKIERKPMDYFGFYYTGLGTIAHELMQRQFGRGKKILGDWKCLECGHKKKLSYYARCKKCGSEHVEYEEIGIKFGKYTHGHIDGVVNIDGKLFVIDYKTSSVKNNNKHRDTGSQYPYKHNVAQIKSYIVYLEEQYGLEVHGWILVYVSRDHNINDFVCVGDIVDEDEKKKLRKKYKLYDKTFGVAEKLKKDKTPEKKMEYLKYLIKHKPCESLKDYKKEFWEGYEIHCPLAESGVCFNKEKLKLTLEKKILGSKTNSIL